MSITPFVVLFSSTDFHQIFCLCGIKQKAPRGAARSSCRRHEGDGDPLRVHLLWQWELFLPLICPLLGASSREGVDESSCKAFVYLLGSVNTGPPFMTPCSRKMASFYMASVFSALLRCVPKRRNTPVGDRADILTTWERELLNNSLIMQTGTNWQTIPFHPNDVSEN